MDMKTYVSGVDDITFWALLATFFIMPGTLQAQTAINATKDIPTLQIRVVSDMSQFPSDAAQAAYALRMGKVVALKESQSDKLIKQLGDKVIELESRIMALERGKK